MSTDIIEVLRRCELFSTIEDEDVDAVAAICTVETYEAGDTVVSQGEYGSRIHLVADGQVALVRSVNLGGRQASTTIDLLGKGRGLGWSSMLCDPCSASASAVCQKPTQTVSMSGEEVREMLEAKPEVGYRVMDRLAQILGHRLRAAYGAMDTFR